MTSKTCWISYTTEPMRHAILLSFKFCALLTYLFVTRMLTLTFHNRHVQWTLKQSWKGWGCKLVGSLYSGRWRTFLYGIFCTDICVNSDSAIQSIGIHEGLNNLNACKQAEILKYCLIVGCLVFIMHQTFCEPVCRLGFHTVSWSVAKTINPVHCRCILFRPELCIWLV